MELVTVCNNKLYTIKSREAEFSRQMLEELLEKVSQIKGHKSFHAELHPRIMNDLQESMKLDTLGLMQFRSNLPDIDIDFGTNIRDRLIGIHAAPIVFDEYAFRGFRPGMRTYVGIDMGVNPCDDFFFMDSEASHDGFD